MRISVYQDHLGIVTLYVRPETRIVEAELADGYRLDKGADGETVIIKEAGGAVITAQRALECGALQLPMLLS